MKVVTGTETYELHYEGAKEIMNYYTFLCGVFACIDYDEVLW